MRHDNLDLERALAPIIAVFLSRLRAAEARVRELEAERDRSVQRPLTDEECLARFGELPPAELRPFMQMQPVDPEADGLAAEVFTLRERVRELEGAVRTLGMCTTCHGSGKHLPSCSMCHDSTWDHKCPGWEACGACNQTGLRAEALAALDAAKGGGA